MKIKLPALIYLWFMLINNGCCQSIHHSNVTSSCTLEIPKDLYYSFIRSISSSAVVMVRFNLLNETEPNATTELRLDTNVLFTWMRRDYHRLIDLPLDMYFVLSPLMEVYAPRFAVPVTQLPPNCLNNGLSNDDRYDLISRTLLNFTQVDFTCVGPTCGSICYRVKNETTPLIDINYKCCEMKQTIQCDNTYKTNHALIVFYRYALVLASIMALLTSIWLYHDKLVTNWRKRWRNNDVCSNKFEIDCISIEESEIIDVYVKPLDIREIEGKKVQFYRPNQNYNLPRKGPRVTLTSRYISNSFWYGCKIFLHKHKCWKNVFMCLILTVSAGGFITALLIQYHPYKFISSDIKIYPELKDGHISYATYASYGCILFAYLLFSLAVALLCLYPNSDPTNNISATSGFNNGITDEIAVAIRTSNKPITDNAFSTERTIDRNNKNCKGSLIFIVKSVFLICLTFFLQWILRQLFLLIAFSVSHGNVIGPYAAVVLTILVFLGRDVQRYNKVKDDFHKSILQVRNDVLQRFNSLSGEILIYCKRMTKIQDHDPTVNEKLMGEFQRVIIDDCRVPSNESCIIEIKLPPMQQSVKWSDIIVKIITKEWSARNFKNICANTPDKVTITIKHAENGDELLHYQVTGKFGDEDFRKQIHYSLSNALVHAMFKRIFYNVDNIDDEKSSDIGIPTELYKFLSKQLTLSTMRLIWRFIISCGFCSLLAVGFAAFEPVGKVEGEYSFLFEFIVATAAIVMGLNYLAFDVTPDWKRLDLIQHYMLMYHANYTQFRRIAAIADANSNKKAFMLLFASVMQWTKNAFVFLFTLILRCCGFQQPSREQMLQSYTSIDDSDELDDVYA